MFDISNNNIIDHIAYCMQDRNNTYLLNLETGECTQDEEPNCVILPPWTSAQGFNIMSSFAMQCQDYRLKEELNKALSSQKGVFKAFRTVLDSNKEQLQSFYNFKNTSMRSYIRSYIKENYTYEEDLPSPLLADYDLSFEPFTPSTNLTEFQNRFSKTLDNATSCIAKTHNNEEAGVISYGTIEDTAYIFYYYINENRRRRGLFNLLLNKVLSSLSPKGVKRCLLPFSSPESYITDSLKTCQSAPKKEILDIDINNWKSVNLSCETIYVL